MTDIKVNEITNTLNKAKEQALKDNTKIISSSHSVYEECNLIQTYDEDEKIITLTMVIKIKKDKKITREAIESCKNSEIINIRKIMNNI